MIYSKANLLSVDIVKPDKSIPALDNLHFRADGTTIAASGMCVLAVSPVPEKTAETVPLANSAIMTDAETVSSETVREVLKGMPHDTLFAGTLEHCDYSSGRFTLTDGKRARTISARTYPREYINYKRIFERVGLSVVRHKVAVNLRRLTDVLATIDKMFPDSSKNMPVYLSFTSEDDVVIQCVDVRGRQECIGVLRSYTGAEGNWIKQSEWKEKLCASSDTTRKINKVKREDTAQAKC